MWSRKTSAVDVLISVIEKSIVDNTDNWSPMKSLTIEKDSKWWKYKKGDALSTFIHEDGWMSLGASSGGEISLSNKQKKKVSNAYTSLQALVAIKRMN